MKDHLKRIAKTSAKTLLRWFSVFLPGIFICLIFFGLSAYVVYSLSTFIQLSIVFIALTILNLLASTALFFPGDEVFFGWRFLRYLERGASRLALLKDHLLGQQRFEPKRKGCQCGRVCHL